VNDKKRKRIVAELQKSYNMELETIINYLSNSVHLDGIRAKHIKDSLTAEVTDEMTHAQTLAHRIKVLEGRIPGSLELKFEQKSLQPPKDNLNIEAVIKGVIDAEEGAIEQYQKIIELCGDDDPVTQDIITGIKGDEEEHRRLFKGFLREAESMRL
jgi:bacterioferritin